MGPCAWPDPGAYCGLQGCRIKPFLSPSILVVPRSIPLKVRTRVCGTDHIGPDYVMENGGSCGCSAGLVDLTSPVLGTGSGKSTSRSLNDGVAGL